VALTPAQHDRVHGQVTGRARAPRVPRAARATRAPARRLRKKQI
jgi:hypothetical protein